MDAYPYPWACSLATFSPHPCIGRYDDGERQPQEGAIPATGLVTYSDFGNKPALFVGMTKSRRLLLPNRNEAGGGPATFGAAEGAICSSMCSWNRRHHPCSYFD